jgi:hypothetical protein
MMNLLRLPRRLMAIAVVLTLALMLATASLASAAPAKPQDVLPPSSCISATPAVQTVGLGQPASLKISAIGCQLPPQPLSNASVVVTWGDGSVSTYVYCLEVCLLYINASHTYTVIGDYHPSICLTVPTPVAETIACTSVEIKVLPVPTA